MPVLAGRSSYLVKRILRLGSGADTIVRSPLIRGVTSTFPPPGSIHTALGLRLEKSFPSIFTGNPFALGTISTAIILHPNIEKPILWFRLASTATRLFPGRRTS